jgi:hypothetical protein
MKCFVYVLAVALLLAGCKKTEAETPPQNPYPHIVVGVEKGGVFVVENEKLIEEEWQKKTIAAGLDIAGFKIVKAKSEGEVRDFYMLLATTSQGTQFAAVLAEEKGQLFFDESSNIITSCRSKTGEKFRIGGISTEGHIRLYCADCTECEKTEGNI